MAPDHTVVDAVLHAEPGVFVLLGPVLVSAAQEAAALDDDLDPDELGQPLGPALGEVAEEALHDGAVLGGARDVQDEAPQRGRCHVDQGRHVVGNVRDGGGPRAGVLGFDGMRVGAAVDEELGVQREVGQRPESVQVLQLVPVLLPQQLGTGGAQGPSREDEVLQVMADRLGCICEEALFVLVSMSVLTPSYHGVGGGRESVRTLTSKPGLSMIIC